MSIKKEDAIKRIGRYLRRDDSHPRFINVNNPEDLESITQQFDVGENVFKAVPDFSAPDENLSEDVFFSYLGNANGTVFVTGLTSYYKLLGEQKLRDFINRVIGMSLIGTHLVVVCYQCEKILANIDKRFSQFIYIVEGEEEELPQLVFTPANMPVPMEKTSVKGVENISAAVERGKIHELFVHTGKHKLAYQFSLYTIKEQNNSFEVLCAMDALTKQLKEEYGTMKQWDTALGKISEYRSWMKYISNVFGSCTNLELAAVSWSYFDSQKKWLYFIALKLYGAKNSWCISEAVKFAENSSLLVRGIYRSILTDDINDKQFWDHYDERKNLIKSLGNSDAEASYKNSLKYLIPMSIESRRSRCRSSH